MLSITCDTIKYQNFRQNCDMQSRFFNFTDIKTLAQVSRKICVNSSSQKPVLVSVNRVSSFGTLKYWQYSATVESAQTVSSS